MNERMSNKRVADLIDLVTADVDYVEDPDELVAALHDLLDARAEIVVATKELTRLSVEIVRAERERDGARKALIWFALEPEIFEGTPNWVQASVIAARAAGKEKRQ